MLDPPVVLQRAQTHDALLLTSGSPRDKLSDVAPLRYIMPSAPAAHHCCLWQAMQAQVRQHNVQLLVKVDVQSPPVQQADGRPQVSLRVVCQNCKPRQCGSRNETCALVPAYSAPERSPHVLTRRCLRFVI